MVGCLVHHQETGLTVVRYCPLDLIQVLGSIHILDPIHILASQ
jgi:hypothetical protein